MRLNLHAKLINICALAVSLIAVVPASVIIQSAHHCSTESTTKRGASGYMQSGGEFGQHHSLPTRPCPVLEFRAGLALISLKQPAIAKIACTIATNGVPNNGTVDPQSAVLSPIYILQTCPDLSVLRILRI